MKKSILFLSLAVMALSCAKEQNPGVQIPEKTSMKFTAVAEEVTKTALDQDGASVKWLAGDQVAVFDGSNINAENGNDEGVRFQAQSEGTSVVISGEANPAAAEYYAIYPFSSGHSMSAENVFTTQIPAQQLVSAGSMADDCAVMLAKAEGDVLHFKNVASLVKFDLAVDGVKSMTLIGNNNEVLAGQFQLVWNEGNPQVQGYVKPEVTVTLRDAAGADLAKGEYYFTILPAEFTKGFSVILGMNDGSQQIVSRSAALALERNKIFRTQAVPENAYKSHVSNFVKYNDGFPLTYCHVTLQKTAEDAYAKYLNDGSNVAVEDGVVAVSADGVYFVGDEAQNVVSRVMACTRVVLAGDNPAVRSKVNVQRAYQPATDENGIILCADLDMTSALNDLIIHNQEFTSFENIVFKNCKINALQRHLANVATKAIDLDYLVLEDCDVMLNNASQANTYLITTNKQAGTIHNIIYKNNVFQEVAATSALQQFAFANCLNSTGTAIGNMTITNNTLVDAKTVKNGFIRAKSMTGACVIESNFFIECHPADTEIKLLNVSTYDAAMTYSIKNNVFFVDGATKKLVAGSVPAGQGDSYEIRTFTFYPLAAGWDPANGIFGYADGIKFGKLQSDGSIKEEDKVSSTWGAHRTVSAAAYNRADNNYLTENLGNY